MNITLPVQGKIVTNITISKDRYEVTFVCSDGVTYLMHHAQLCCEAVYLEDVCGDLDDLLHCEMLAAEEVSNYDGPTIDCASYTWTFYKFQTKKGSVTMRWLGCSNGYYSESVDFIEKDKL